MKRMILIVLMMATVSVFGQDAWKRKPNAVVTDANGNTAGVTDSRLDVYSKHADSADIDAFGRLRVSQPANTFDMQFHYDKQPLFFEEDVTGNGTATHVPDLSAVRLSTGGTDSGDKVVFHSRYHLRYQPAKSDTLAFTCTLGAKKANVRKRIGQFTIRNGLFWEQDGSNLKIVRRSFTSGSAVDVAVNQSDWNLDVMDGTGSSGVTLVETNDNIFVIDKQYLGAGRIRFGFDIAGRIVYVHEVNYANTDPAPYMTTAHLPFRVEIENTAGAASSTAMDFFCMASSSEGGFDPLGIEVSARSLGLRTVSTTTQPLPVFSIRPRTSFNSITNTAQVIPAAFEIMSEDATVAYDIILNGTLLGAAWTNVNTSSSIVEFDVNATNITGGLVIDSGFITGGKDKDESGVGGKLLSKLILAHNDEDGSADVLSIVFSTFTSADTASDCGASFKWKELR